ncbi:MAG: transposase [Anaerolineaceae bacterium]
MFLFSEPLAGKRHVKVTDHRTKKNWAVAMRELSNVHYPEAEKIIVVMDNLNTHSPASFYEAFTPEEARRLTNRFEFHYPPKHGCWLDMAEIELSAFSRSLKLHIPTPAILENEVRAITNERNETHAIINWQFRTKDARIKLLHLYPSISA